MQQLVCSAPVLLQGLMLCHVQMGLLQPGLAMGWAATGLNQRAGLGSCLRARSQQPQHPVPI